MNVRNLSEEQLVEGIMEGSHTYFDEFVARHETNLFQLITAFVSHTESAEEVLANTFLRAYRELSSRPDERRTAVWITGICLEQIEERRSLEEASIAATSERINGALKAGSDMDAAAGFLHHEQKNLARIIRKLPWECRLIFVLRDVQGFSFEEISWVLGISPSEAKSQLNVARVQILSLYRDERGSEECNVENDLVPHAPSQPELLM